MAVKEVNPAIVDAVAPRAIEVLPTVNELLANLLLGIAFVPISPPLYVKPEPLATLISPVTSELDGPVYVITPELLF